MEPPGQFLLGLICAADDNGRRVIRWKQVSAAVGVVCLAGAFLLCFATWTYLVRAQGLAEVRYVDTLTPNGWRRIRKTIGDHAISEANAALKKNDLNAALRLYRLGLAKSPRNAAGRIDLARLYVTLHRPDLARDLLTGGLPNLAENDAYLEFTFSFLLEFQFDAELRRAAEPLLTHSSPTVRRQSALRAATLALYRGDFDGAENLLVAHHLTVSPEGALLLARADLERGFPELALARLTPALASNSAQTAALALSAQIDERLGRPVDSTRAAALRVADDPLSAAPRVAVLQQLRAEARPLDLAREIDSFIRLFPHDQPALLALGDFAASSGDPELARRIQQLFAQHQWSLDAPALLSAEACIVAGRHAEGLAELEHLLQENPRSVDRYGPVIDGLRTIALFGLNRADDAQLSLEHLLAQPNLRAENLSAVATRLLAFGRASSARAVLSRAVTIEPRNQAALTTLVRLESEQDRLDTLPAHLRQLLALRRPSREVLAFVYHRLGSDLNLLHPEQLALLTELREHLSGDRTVAASAKR